MPENTGTPPSVAGSDNAENPGKKPVDFRVISQDDTKISKADDTKINNPDDTKIGANALRDLIRSGKRITPTMRLTTYTSGGSKYFRYQESSANLRKTNPPVHLAPYIRRKGSDKTNYDDRAKIEAFKAKRKAKSRRGEKRRSDNHSA